MDNITHSLTGLMLSRAGLNRISPEATWVLLLAANAPDIDEFLAMLEPAVPDAEVTVGTIGPVIGVHTGPRVMGIAWIDRQE